MARARKPDSERLTEYVGVPLSTKAKRRLEANAKKAGTRPVPYVRRLIEADKGELVGAK